MDVDSEPDAMMDDDEPDLGDEEPKMGGAGMDDGPEGIGKGPPPKIDPKVLEGLFGGAGKDLFNFDNPNYAGMTQEQKTKHMLDELQKKMKGGGMGSPTSFLDDLAQKNPGLAKGGAGPKSEL